MTASTSTSRVRDWLAGPAFRLAAGQQLYLRVAVTDVSSEGPGRLAPDDSVSVYLSADCGQNWQRLRAFTAADSLPNTLRPFALDLSAYGGQVVALAVQAARPGRPGPASATFHVGGLEVRTPPGLDVAPVALVAPAARGCLGGVVPVQVRVQNFGSAPAANVPVRVVVGGPVPQQLNAVLAGPLAPGGSAVLAVGTASLTAAGTYLISARTLLPGDAYSANDSLAPARRQALPATPAPTAAVTFTGFNSSNLSTIAPGWHEETGRPLPGTSGNSRWVRGDAAHQAVLGSETAALNLTGTTATEWIVSPPVRLGSGSSFLNFRLALTQLGAAAGATTLGTDDSLRVLISTDCGGSYQRLRVFSRADALGPRLTNFSLPLSAYAGQTVLLAFHGTDGPFEDLANAQVHLDDIAVQATPLAARAAQATTLTFSLYPNPTAFAATLEAPAVPAARFTVRDLSGRLVRAGQLAQGRAELDVRALPTGIYLVQLQTDEGTVVRRLAVE